MYEKLGKSISRRPSRKFDNIKFGPWPDGLVTEYEPEQMKSSQLFEAMNMISVGSGVQRTRDGSSLVCDGCTGGVVCVKDIKVGDTWYTIISDTDNKLYRDNSGTATAIATLEGEAQFCAFMGLLIIFDGSYIKAWDGTDVFILYDNGLGATTPYQVTNRTATYDDSEDKPLGNGSITSVELSFTTQAWDAGYTIPPTHVFAQLYRVGSPSGSITAKLKTTGDVEVATSTITVDAIALTTDTGGEEYESLFNLDTGITTEMAPETTYKIVLEFTGDASNYVVVKAVDSATPMFSLKPGRPPKSAFGLVHEARLHCIEGEDGENPSYDYYCAAGNHLDWSTKDGGGYAPVIDQSATNFPIGGIASWNESLWFFGTQRQPFLAALSGDSPSNFTISATMQRISGHYKSIVVTADNIIFLHQSGIDMITSVEDSTDIAAESQAENIRKTIQKYYSTGAVAGYDPLWGLYAIKLEGTDDVLVINTRAKSLRYSGKKYSAFSPVNRWRFAFSGKPTFFGPGNGFMYVGTDDGKLYKMDGSEQDDNGITVERKIITSSSSTVFGSAQAYKIGYRIFGRFGGSCNIKFYKDYSRTSFFTLPFSLPLDSTITTAELDSLLTADADFYSTPGAYFDREGINFNFRNLMVGIEDITLFGGAIYVGDIRIQARSIGGL